MTAANLELRRDSVARGIILILLSTMLTATQDATFKQISGEVTLWQVYVLRSLFLIPALLGIAFLWGDGATTWRQSLRPWPMCRAALFMLMYGAMYAAIPVLPLSAIAAGLYTAPLFVAALSAPLLGEKVGWRGLLAIVIGFVGVLVILRPGTEAFSWLMLLPVMGGLFYALSAIVTRSKCRSVPPAALALSLSFILLLTGVVASLALALSRPAEEMVAISPFLIGPWGAPGLFEWSMVVLLATLMVANGLVLPAAYQSAPSVTIATFDYCYLICATALGFLVFAEVPDQQTAIGMLMIAAAGLMVVRR